MPAPISASHSEPSRLRAYRNTGMAPAAIAADCAVNMIQAPGAIQYSGTRNNRTNDVWSPNRLRPISVTNGASNRESSHMPWS